MIYVTALTIGIMGSTHCLGMCGPLVLALPLNRQEKRQLAFQAFQYNIGRVITYALLGLLLGFLGKGLFLAGIQKGFSVFLGLVLLIVVLFKINLESQFIRLPLVHQYTQLVKQAVSKQLLLRNSHLTLGLLNGLLPCGLVYLALAGAVTTAAPWQGALFMLLFGLGTMPLMIGVFFVKNTLTHKIKHHLRHIASFVMLGVALLLIFRGFSIQFPTELRFWEAINHPVMCH